MVARGGEGEEVAKGNGSLTFPLRDELYLTIEDDGKVISLLNSGLGALGRGETALHWVGMKG